jgi:hypothetical protein
MAVNHKKTFTTETTEITEKDLRVLRDLRGEIGFEQWRAQRIDRASLDTLRHVL